MAKRKTVIYVVDGLRVNAQSLDHNLRSSASLSLLLHLNFSKLALSKDPSMETVSKMPLIKETGKKTELEVQIPWSEKYRPQTLDDIAAHSDIISTSEFEIRLLDEKPGGMFVTVGSLVLF